MKASGIDPACFCARFLRYFEAGYPTESGQVETRTTLTFQGSFMANKTRHQNRAKMTPGRKLLNGSTPPIFIQTKEFKYLVVGDCSESQSQFRKKHTPAREPKKCRGAKGYETRGGDDDDDDDDDDDEDEDTHTHR